MYIYKCPALLFCIICCCVCVRLCACARVCARVCACVCVSLSLSKQCSILLLSPSLCYSCPPLGPPAQSAADPQIATAALGIFFIFERFLFSSFFCSFFIFFRFVVFAFNFVAFDTEWTHARRGFVNAAIAAAEKLNSTEFACQAQVQSSESEIERESV